MCDEMKSLVTRVVSAEAGPAATASIEVVDISTDPDLEARYGLEIPVLLIDGKKVAKYRVTEEALRRLLASMAGTAGGAG